MAASGKTHHRDLRRVDVPLRRAAAHEPHGALGVEQRHRMAVAVHRQAVEENEGGDPALLEPLRLVDALMLEGQHAVAAAGQMMMAGPGLAGFSGR